jgi:hypothetical protein
VYQDPGAALAHGQTQKLEGTALACGGAAQPPSHTGGVTLASEMIAGNHTSHPMRAPSNVLRWQRRGRLATLSLHWTLLRATGEAAGRDLQLATCAHGAIIGCLNQRPKIMLLKGRVRFQLPLAVRFSSEVPFYRLTCDQAGYRTRDDDSTLARS